MLGQNDTKPTKQFVFTAIEIQENTSELVPHHDTLNPLKKGYITDYEVNFILGTTGNKQWHSVYHYPNIGITTKYINFHYSNVLGQAIATYPFIQFNLNLKKRFYSSLRIGLGIAYLSKKYNQTENPTNIAISTSLNVIGNMQIRLGYRLSQKVDIVANLNGTHLSNGAYKKPNYGINMAGLGIGIKYNINSYQPFHSEQWESKSNKSIASIGVLGGIKEVGGAGGSKYYPITLQLAYLKPATRFFTIGAGFDLMYDKSSKFDILQKNQHYSSPNDDICIGAVSHFQFPLDRFSSFAEIGLYVYNPNPKSPIVYQRIGLNYRLSTRMSFVLALKTHLTVADHIDWGFAITI